MRGARHRVLSVCALGVFGLSGCGGDEARNEQARETPPTMASAAPESAPASPSTRAGEQVSYRIEEFTFPTMKVAPGALVRVSNGDDSPHTLSAADGSFDTGLIRVEETKEFLAPLAPGSYPIECKIHTSMKGVLVVEASSSD